MKNRVSNRGSLSKARSNKKFQSSVEVFGSTLLLARHCYQDLEPKVRLKTLCNTRWIPQTFELCGLYGDEDKDSTALTALLLLELS